MVIESASDRILRILVVAVGIGGVVFALLGLGEIIAQQPGLDPAFSIVVYVVYLGVPPALAALAFRLPVFALRVALGAHAVAAVIILAAWYRAVDPASLPSDVRPWIFFTITVATCTAALAFPYIVSIGYTLAVAVVCGILRFELAGAVDATPGVQDALFIVLFSVVLVTLLQLVLRSGRLQDAALHAAQAEATASSAAEAFERQRVRYQQFARDDVLAVFGRVLAEGRATRPETRAEAAVVLHKLDELQGDVATPAFLGAAEFEALLRGASPSSLPLGITVIDRPDTPVLIPVDVGDTLAEAMGEAIRNSIEHAERPDGTPVLRRVLVSITANHVQIVVSDDGRGFTAGRIAPDRLGVRVSILQGVNGLPGGSATVESSRSGGTIVTLHWRKDARR